MIHKDEFLKKYNITKSDFKATKLVWSELENIYNHFDKTRLQYEPTAKDITERIISLKKVHSVKFRVKDSEHLIAKIIRKTIDNVKLKVTIDNYSDKLTDIVGVRALHLFKDDWEEIHDFITATWDFKEPPIANVREGDTPAYTKIFKNKGCKIKVHPQGYRSVHYLVKSNPTKRSFVSEIQVRTIFEEGWSEIDHTIRYPYNMDNQILAQYLNIFNRFAGSADEMGTYIKYLQKELTAREVTISDNEKTINDLKSKIESLKIDKETKVQIGTSLDQLLNGTKVLSIQPGDVIYSVHGSNQAFSFPSNPIIFNSDQPVVSAVVSLQHCTECGNSFYNNTLTTYTTKCDNCRNEGLTIK